jgi:Zn-dependent protease with chaperone function
MDEKAGQRAKIIAESLYENEALRDRLDDERARELLEWATQAGENIAQQTARMDDEQAEGFMYPRLKSLRRRVGMVRCYADLEKIMCE